MNQLNPKNFPGETKDINSKDATQCIKTVESLEWYAFKVYKADMSSLFQLDKPKTPTVEIPQSPIKSEA